MYRATTPSQIFHFDENLSGCSNIQITYSQNDIIVLEKEKEDLSWSADGKTASFVMTQEETKLFSQGIIKIQIRVLTTGGAVYASKEIKVSIKDVLHDNILSGGSE